MNCQNKILTACGLQTAPASASAEAKSGPDKNPSGLWLDRTNGPGVCERLQIVAGWQLWNAYDDYAERREVAPGTRC